MHACTHTLFPLSLSHGPQEGTVAVLCLSPQQHVWLAAKTHLTDPSLSLFSLKRDLPPSFHIN